jgi:hypothetical protein
LSGTRGQKTKGRFSCFFIKNKRTVPLLHRQTISVNLDIPIPADSVIISKVQLEELKKAQLRGTYWYIKYLEKKVYKENVSNATNKTP